MLLIPIELLMFIKLHPTCIQYVLQKRVVNWRTILLEWKWIQYLRGVLSLQGGRCKNLNVESKNWNSGDAASWGLRRFGNVERPSPIATWLRNVVWDSLAVLKHITRPIEKIVEYPIFPKHTSFRFIMLMVSDGLLRSFLRGTLWVPVWASYLQLAKASFWATLHKIRNLTN